MPDLDTALDELRRFAARPASVLPDLDKVIGLARVRRRRRRSVLGTLLVAVIVVVSLVAVTRGPGDPADLHTVDDNSSSTTVTDTGRGLGVSPSTGLTDGQVVEVTLPKPPAADAIVVQCASEAASAADPVPWCDLNTVSEPATDGFAHFRVTVTRTIETSNGLVDCAVAERRCLIGVRSAGSDLTAAISFRADLDPVATPTIAAGPPTAVSGEAVTVTGVGYAPGVEVTLWQCRANPIEGGTDGCDGSRAISVTTDAQGRFTKRVLVYDEVFADYDGWLTCTPCLIEARAIRHSPATATIEVGPSATSTRPTVTISPQGPYRPDQRVQLRGTGFQADSDRMTIGWCRFNTADPAHEAQGAGPGYATCRYPDTTSVMTDGNGSFVINDFPMPPPTFADGACQGPAIRCGLAWHPGEGAFPFFITFFHMLTP